MAWHDLVHDMEGPDDPRLTELHNKAELYEKIIENEVMHTHFRKPLLGQMYHQEDAPQDEGGRAGAQAFRRASTAKRA